MLIVGSSEVIGKERMGGQSTQHLRLLGLFLRQMLRNLPSSPREFIPLAEFTAQEVRLIATHPEVEGRTMPIGEKCFCAFVASPSLKE